jgi:hypothetical protein
MSQMIPASANDLENKRQQLLAALAALPAVGVGVDKPLLRSIQEKDPSEWGDEEWDAANARELLSPELKAQYTVRLLERQQAAEREALFATYQGGNIPGLGQATHHATPSADLMAGMVPVREGIQGEPSTEPDDEPYENWKVAELQEEVRLRNEQRDDDSKLAPASTRKEDLVTALEQDDQRA